MSAHPLHRGRPISFLSLSGGLADSLPAPPVSPEALLRWAARLHDLRVEWVSVPGGGARYSRGFGRLGGGVVRIDHRLRGPALTCTLAEEIGHHVTFYDLPMPRGVRPTLNELRALRWAAAVLLPGHWCRPGDSEADIARRWCVTANFVRRAARLPSALGSPLR